MDEVDNTSVKKRVQNDTGWLHAAAVTWGFNQPWHFVLIDIRHHSI